MAFLVTWLLWSTPVDLFELGRAQVESQQELAAIKTLTKAKAQAAQRPNELATIYLWLGLAHAQLADDQKAVAAFRAGLVLNPRLELPASVTSPRIKAWFAEAGGRVERDPPVAAVTPITVNPEPPPVVALAEPRVVAATVKPEPAVQRPALSLWWSLSLGVVTAGLGVTSGLLFAQSRQRSAALLTTPLTQPWSAPAAERLAAEGSQFQSLGLGFALGGAAALVATVVLLLVHVVQLTP